MPATKLQKNLHILMKENNYKVSDIEKLASLKKNQCYNIVKGASIKPSNEIVEAIAGVFGLTAEDLCKEDIHEGFLSNDDIDYLEKVANIVFKEIRFQNLSLLSYEIFKVIMDSYKYSRDTNSLEPDEKYVKWTLTQRFASRGL